MLCLQYAAGAPPGSCRRVHELVAEPAERVPVLPEHAAEGRKEWECRNQHGDAPDSITEFRPLLW